MPRLIDSLKSCSIGHKDLYVEEGYIANRILDLVRLPGYMGKTHDVVIPKAMVGGLIRSIFKSEQSTQTEVMSDTEYIRRFSLQSSQRCIKNIDSDENVGMIAAILRKNDSMVD